MKTENSQDISPNEWDELGKTAFERSKSLLLLVEKKYGDVHSITEDIFIYEGFIMDVENMEKNSLDKPEGWKTFSTFILSKDFNSEHAIELNKIRRVTGNIDTPEFLNRFIDFIQRSLLSFQSGR